jgi:hypothetical protein
MIRKIALFFVVTFVTLWFFGAHLVKNKLISAISELESDNIKISYQDTKISGFPFYWQVTFISPKVSVIDQKSIKEISGQALNVRTDYLIQNIGLDLGNMVNYSDISGVENKREYNLISNKDMRIDVFFQKPLYFLDFDSAWKTIYSLTKFDLGTIEVSSQENKLFAFSDIQAISETKQIGSVNSMNFKLTGDYGSEYDESKVKNAHLLLDLSYFINNPLLSSETQVDFERKIELSKFQLKLDDASLDMRGALNLSRSNLPRGDFDVALVKYHDVINKIVPEDFIVSSSYIKQVINKVNAAEAGNNAQNVNFKIFFSNKGISVGKDSDSGVN